MGDGWLSGLFKMYKEQREEKNAHKKKYPELAKFCQVESDYNDILRFVSWLYENEHIITSKESLADTSEKVVDIILRYFGIDAKKLQDEIDRDIRENLGLEETQDD